MITYQQLIKSFETKFIQSKSKGIDKRDGPNVEINYHDTFKTVENKLTNGSFRFTPYLEKLVSKGRGKPPRVLSIPTIRDRTVLHALKEILHDLIPDGVPNKKVQRIIRQIKENLAEGDYDVYFRLDLLHYYDTIDRGILREKLLIYGIPENLAKLIDAATSNPTVPKDYRRDSINNYLHEAGVPQGLSVSNILANIYLQELDKLFKHKNCLYVRYVDDIIVFCNRSTLSEYETLLKNKISLLKLVINEEKTIKGEMSKGVTFLGHTFKENSVTIAEKNVQKRIALLAGKFTRFKKGWWNKNLRMPHLKDDKLYKKWFLEDLNIAISGVKSEGQIRSFIEYFKEINDPAIMYRLDRFLDRMFENIPSFKKRPKLVHSFAKSYYLIKYGDHMAVIVDLDQIQSTKRRKSYLQRIGLIDRNKEYSDDHIDRVFKSHQLQESVNNSIFNEYY